MVAPLIEAQKSATRIAKPQASLFDLVKPFNTQAEIIAYKNGTVRVFAEAMDMPYDACMNLMLKLKATQDFLHTPLTMKINGEEIPMRHPLTGKDLCAGDILGERSGPKYSFPLKQVAGDQFHDNYSSRHDIVQNQTSKAAAFAKANGYTVSAEEIALAASIFKNGHVAQRILADFDLEVADYGLLKEAMLAAYTAKTGKEIPTSLQDEVVMSHLTYGGEIFSSRVESAANVEISYQSKVKEEFTKGKTHKHFLQAKSSEDLHTKMENHFAPTVVAKGREIKSFAGVIVQKEHYTTEFFDVVLNPVSDLTGILSKSMIDEKAMVDLRKVVGAENITQLLAAEKYQPFDFQNLAQAAVQAHSVDAQKISRIAETHKDKITFLDNALLMQENGRKLSLSETQGIEKQIGNISDIAPSLQKVARESKNDPDMLPLQQLAELSYLTSLPRWGVNSENLEHIGEFTKNITAKKFANRMNEKSYQGAEGGAREQIGWSNISEKVAAERLQTFHEGAAPLHQFAKENGAYFEKAAPLAQSLKNYQQAPEAYEKAFAEMKTEMKNILSKMPELTEKLAVNTPEKRDEMATSFTIKAVESIEFNARRMELEKSRQAGHAVGDNGIEAIADAAKALISGGHTVKEMNAFVIGGKAGERYRG